MNKALTLLLLLATATSYAQNAEISGTISDPATKEPLAGASVRYDKSRGVLTDANGHYHLSLAEGEYDFVFNFIGYKKDKQTIKLAAGEKKVINVALKADAFQFNQITSVSQYKKNSAKETVSTEVISKDNIKHTNSNDLGEALNRTTGVLVQDGQISIRGGSSYSYGVGTRTAVTQDGLSITSADLGEPQNKMAQLSNVKQIEVIKGASSVIYGSSALNGVINVITAWPTEDTPRTEIDINGGVYNETPRKYQQWWAGAPPFFTNINFNHQQKKKNIQFVVGANLTGNTGYLQLSGEFRMQGLFKLRYVSPKIEGLSMGLNGSAQWETSDRFFIAKNSDTAAFTNAKGSSDKYTRTNIDPFLAYANSKGHSYKLNTKYMNIFRNGNGTDPNAVSHQFMIDNQYQYKWKNMIVLTTGVPFAFSTSSSNLYVRKRDNLNAAVYAQLEFNYKRLSVQAGVRYEVQKVDTIVESGIPIFRSGINLQVGKASFLRASWGQAYRIPTLGEKYIAQNFYTTGSTNILVIPNDTLHTETGWSAEIGFNQGFQIGKNFKGFVDFSIFWQQYKNFTEYLLATWPNFYADGKTKIFPDSVTLAIGNFRDVNHVVGIKAINDPAARIFGYELGVGAKGTIGKVGLTIGAGYSYNFPRIIPQDGDPSHPHESLGDFISKAFEYNFKKVPVNDTANLLFYRIRHIVKADIEISYWKFYAGATVVYGSFPERVPILFEQAINLIAGDTGISFNKYKAAHDGGDVTADIRIGYKHNAHISFGFIVKNVANRFYMLRPGKPEPMRNYTLQFRYSF